MIHEEGVQGEDQLNDISDVYVGKLHPRVAAGLAPLMDLQLWGCSRKRSPRSAWPGWSGS
jgi:hypothetical protein